jgi:hypothetical protein
LSVAVLASGALEIIKKGRVIKLAIEARLSQLIDICIIRLVNICIGTSVAPFGAVLKEFFRYYEEVHFVRCNCLEDHRVVANTHEFLKEDRMYFDELTINVEAHCSTPKATTGVLVSSQSWEYSEY